MTDNVNWGSSRMYDGYVTTSASSGSGFAGVATAVDWGQYYTRYQPSQVQQGWYSHEFIMQPMTEEAKRIADGWDADENNQEIT